MLNDNQKLVVNSEAQQILVLAGAGTGKTKVVIHRIEHLINQGVLPEQIVVTTFTNKAAFEIRERLAEYIGEAAFKIVSGTFHKISSYYLKKFSDMIGIPSNFQILVEDDQKQLLKQILKDLDIKNPPKHLANEISRVKENQTTNHDIDFKRIFAMYEKRLKEGNFLDYSDLIHNAILLFKHDKEFTKSLCKHVLIDEYQDINQAQYEWIKLLSCDNNLICVGDEDQSIYGFRGSNIKYIQNFQNDYPNAQIVFLDQNYRSSKEILQGAVNLIQKNDKKFPKQLIANKIEAGAIKVYTAFNEYDEARLVGQKIIEWKEKHPKHSIAVLVRTNTQINYIEHALVELGIQYTLGSGKKFYEKKEIKNLIYYLRVVNSSSDYLAFTHIINVPKRGIGDVKLQQLLDAMKSFNADFETALNILIPQMPKIASEKCRILLMQIKNWRTLKDSLTIDELIKKILEDLKYIELEEVTKPQSENIKNFLEYSKQYKKIEDMLENFHFTNQEQEEDENQVQIMTMHASKGLEFDIVIAPGWEEEVFPSVLSKSYSEIQEERRLAYVTITRAKQFLDIIKCKFRKVHGRNEMRMPSRFIYEI